MLENYNCLLTLYDIQYIEKTAEELDGDYKVLSATDPNRSALFYQVRDRFKKEFQKKVSLTYIDECLINGKKAILVFMDKTSFHLPAEYEGYPVYFSNVTVELY